MTELPLHILWTYNIFQKDWRGHCFKWIDFHNTRFSSHYDRPHNLRLFIFLQYGYTSCWKLKNRQDINSKMGCIFQHSTLRLYLMEVSTCLSIRCYLFSNYFFFILTFFFFPSLTSFVWPNVVSAFQSANCELCIEKQVDLLCLDIYQLRLWLACYCFLNDLLTGDDDDRDIDIPIKPLRPAIKHPDVDPVCCFSISPLHWL